jgi:hypothetical protein
VVLYASTLAAPSRRASSTGASWPASASRWSRDAGVPGVPPRWLGEPLLAGEAGRDALAGTPFLQLYFLYVLAGVRGGVRAVQVDPGRRSIAGPRGPRGRLTIGRALGVTFGIFLIHPLVLYPVQDHWPLPGAPAAFAVGLFAHLVITLVGSLALTLVLRRIPYVRATVG